MARAEGLVVFVAGALPGDRVRAEITKAKKRFAEARARSSCWPPYELAAYEALDTIVVRGRLASAKVEAMTAVAAAAS